MTWGDLLSSRHTEKQPAFQADPPVIARIADGRRAGGASVATAGAALARLRGPAPTICRLAAGATVARPAGMNSHDRKRVLVAVDLAEPTARLLETAGLLARAL